MRRALYGLTAALFIGTMANAQDRAWIQVEARPSLAEGQDRARAWSTAFGDVAGYRLNSGWFGIVLGPYAPDEAAARLADLKRQGMIPPDSYVTDGRPFRDPFWTAVAAPEPATGGALPAPAPEVSPLEPAPQPLVVDPQTGAITDPATPPTVVATPEPAPAPALPDETPEQARASESALLPEQRMELQTALKWFGFYDAAVDGAFGRGTRASMAAWQEAQGLEPTGILTTAQRTTLTDAYTADQRDFGFQTVTEAESGIEIALPLAMVAFDHYEPPFVHYTAKDNSGIRIVLISSPGDASTLEGLYDTLQTLSILPESGPRERGERGFTIEGVSATAQSHAQAELARGMVKGFILSGPPEKSAQLARILSAMKSTFRPVGDKALDPGLVTMDAGARAGLLSGLEVKTPKLSRSGLFVDGKGTVLTTAEAVAQCGKITLERETPARVVLTDATAGIAVLAPEIPLSPRAVATFQTATPRMGGEVAVSGYSYETRLPAPTLTFGALAEGQGLNGEPGLNRLAVPVLAGDAGGPVVDPTGAVIGMLLPHASGARVLPQGVAFAATSTVLTDVLTRAGIAGATASRTAPATPDALAREAAAITAIVSCWD